VNGGCKRAEMRPNGPTVTACFRVQEDEGWEGETEGGRRQSEALEIKVTEATARGERNDCLVNEL
jgi:hypothetical protein